MRIKHWFQRNKLHGWEGRMFLSWIAGFCEVADGLVRILTLGRYSGELHSRFVYKWYTENKERLKKVR